MNTRRTRTYRIIATFLILTMINQVLFPLESLALTTGPQQPEVQSFEPVGTTDMVDLFSGDFNYNIPLMEVPGPNGGYPLNMFYHSGISMDQEATWVGLGWNLNPGSITREMRGLPDEFNGDKVKVTEYMKPNITVGVGGKADVELFGLSPLENSNLTLGMSVFYNSKK